MIKTDLIILGAGSAGYTAAFRAADLNIKTILIEQKSIGGTCLNEGCIPTKSLLQITQSLDKIKQLKKFGLQYNDQHINLKKIQAWKKGIINKLKLGLKNTSSQKKINIITGFGKFKSKNIIEVKQKTKVQLIEFKNAIIATGSKDKPSEFKNNDVITPSQALNLKNIPRKILIIGSGYIGLELATFFSSLKSKVDIIEKSNNILTDFDQNIVTIYKNQIKKSIKNIFLNEKIKSINIKKNGVKLVDFYNKKSSDYDIIISAIGREANIENLGLKNIGINIKDNFINITDTTRTNIENIYACGDVTGYPMLAHKAFYQAKLAAENIAGYKHFIQYKCIPSVIYTNPEIAQVGITEDMAKKLKLTYTAGICSWTKTGKGVIINAKNNTTKLIFNKEKIIIGASIIGYNASELISELALAIEMGCHENDIALTIHPHPTLSETIVYATELQQFENNKYENIL